MTTQNQIPAVLAPSALPDDTLVLLQVVGVDSPMAMRFSELVAENCWTDESVTDIREALTRDGYFADEGFVVTIAPTRPIIGMAAFFALPCVRLLQGVQKSQPYGSAFHRDAFNDMLGVARLFMADAQRGVATFLGDY